MAAFTPEELREFSMAKWFDLSGRTAIVTGGATGLGLAITRCLISAGARAAVFGRSAPETAAAALKEFGDRAVYYQYDVTDTGRAQEMADRVAAELGGIDILVNNAGNHCKK